MNKKQEEMWEGKFGDEYQERNKDSELMKKRQAFWDMIMCKHIIPDMIERAEEKEVKNNT